MALYLLSSVTNGNGLTMEFKLVDHKKDMRTTFCKLNRDCEVDPMSLVQAISELSLYIKNDRIIFSSSLQARAFAKIVKLAP